MWCKECDIQPNNVLNFNEAGFQVGVTPSYHGLNQKWTGDVSIEEQKPDQLVVLYMRI
jgi:hypothetical protein